MRETGIERIKIRERNIKQCYTDRIEVGHSGGRAVDDDRDVVVLFVSF